ncbi:MAG: hypothetical protein ABI761_05790 [Saprospiraceae bacterium]
MNELNLNESTLDLYDNFSKNILNEHDATEFRNKLEQDQEFNAGYQAFLMSKEVINEKIALHLRDQMKEWNVKSTAPENTEPGKIIDLPKRKTSERKINWIKWTAAASVLFVLSVGIKQYFFYKTYTDQLLNEQVVMETGATRSEPSPPSRINIDKIIKDLGENPKTEAIENAISELSKGNSMDDNYQLAQLQIGKLYTYLGNWPMAEKAYFNGKADKNLMDISEILALMKSKQTETSAFKNKLDQILHDSDDTNHDIAKQIQTKTNTIWWKLYN